MIDWVLILGIIIPLTLSALFSGLEIAFVSSDRLFLELQTQRKGYQFKALKFVISRPSLFLTTTLLGNTIALVIYGTFMTAFMKPYIDVFVSSEIISLVLGTIISTLMVLFLAEFLPKTLFMVKPNQALALLSIPFALFTVVMYPMIWLVDQIARIVIKQFFKVEFSMEKQKYQLDDLNNYLKDVLSKKGESGDNDLGIEAEILTNALDFKSVKTRDCMIPRIELEAVQIVDSVDILRDRFVSTGFSKILVYKETIDNIIGYCHSSQLFKKPKSIAEMLTPIDFVPETALANDVMVTLNKNRRSIAIVVDEFGGTAGLVAIEDIIEEIFGDIKDEHDKKDLMELKLDSYNYLFSARQEVEYLNEKYQIGLPLGEYETLGGLILSELGDIPNKEDIVKFDDFFFTIKQMDGVKINQVKLTLIE